METEDRGVKKRLRAQLLVIGENPGGLAAAIVAARAGINTILVSHHSVLGGFFPSLGAIESHYRGVRSPFLRRLEEDIIGHYLNRFGAEGQPYLDCITLEPNNPMITFEPHVAEQVLEAMVQETAGLRVLRGYFSWRAHVEGRKVRAVTIRSNQNEDELVIEADSFIDATSEGDLMCQAGAAYRVGREGRSEYGESHAGKLFTRYVKGRFPQEAVEGKLNILPKWTTRELLPGSTGEGDDCIQDYSYRLTLSCDPDNRLLPEKPDGYDHERFRVLLEDPAATGCRAEPFHHRYLTNSIEDQAYGDHLFHGHKLPNGKRSWNATNYTGAAKAYPEADWKKRAAIETEHLQHALGIMYFLQRDEAVPEDIRTLALEWGLAKDEFVPFGHIPPKVYVREARRLLGRYVMREHDFKLAAKLQRAPIHADAIAIAEFALDSLPCTTERVPGSIPDGQFFLQDETRPGQIPFRSLLPQELDNLLVTETCSASHVAWGTIRQTPVLIQLGEAAGWAVALANRQGIEPAEVPVEWLQMQLVEQGHMIAFFNDFDMAACQSWVPAIQYLATKGFFASYDARPDQPLDERTAHLWLEGFTELLTGTLEPMRLAARLQEGVEHEPPVTGVRLARLLGGLPPDCLHRSMIRQWIGQCEQLGSTLVLRHWCCEQMYEICKQICYNRRCEQRC